MDATLKASEPTTWEGRGGAGGRSAAADRVKRALDVLLGTVLIVILSPLIAALAAAIKLDSPGPVFYRCRRVGVGGRELQMLKFRKMADGASGPALTHHDDDRFTRVGRILARTKLDELPQLCHVLRGEMSLVGPRPEDSAFVGLYPDAYDEILSVKPGITGLSQLAFVSEMKILGEQDRVRGYVDRLLPAKVQLDLLYVRNRSLRMDLTILAWTVGAVVLRLDAAVHRSSGRVSYRRRPSEAPLRPTEER